MPEPKTKEDILKLLRMYANEMVKPATYAGEIELAVTSHFLGVNINIVTLGFTSYKNYWYYKSILNTPETINILFINQNHYNLLIKREKEDNNNESISSVNNEDNGTISKYHRIKF